MVVAEAEAPSIQNKWKRVKQRFGPPRNARSKNQHIGTCSWRGFGQGGGTGA